MTTATASGKIILFGEHAVVYGRPALAVPLPGLRARVRVEPASSRAIVIHAPDIGQEIDLDRAEPGNPLAAITRAALQAMGVSRTPALEMWIESDIPPASGLGSGAAVSTAVVRALAAHFQVPLDAEGVSALVFETEKLYHGTPSGIDNAVIALERPIRFTRQQGARPFPIARSFPILIANTGIASPTRVTVGDVRRGWQADPERYERLFDAIARVVERAERALGGGELSGLGHLMTENQGLLTELGVSSVEIGTLLYAAGRAGAAGGKLSGGGRGGNVIICPGAADAPAIEAALLAAGAPSVLQTEVKASEA